MPLPKMILTGFMLCIVIATSACSTPGVRVAQIPLREDLTRCLVLEPIAPEQWLPRVPDPDLSGIFDAAGVPRPAFMAVLNRAAGDYARDAQIKEQEFGANRDLAQGEIVRTGCVKQAELATLIRINNAGPEQ